MLSYKEGNCYSVFPLALAHPLTHRTFKVLGTVLGTWDKLVKKTVTGVAAEGVDCRCLLVILVKSLLRLLVPLITLVKRTFFLT